MHLYIYVVIYIYICAFMCRDFEKQIADLIAYCTLCTVVIRCSVVCIETVALFFLFFESLFRQENQSARGAAGKEKQSLGKTCDECILVSTNNFVSCLLVFSSLKGFTFLQAIWPPKNGEKEYECVPFISVPEWGRACLSDDISLNKTSSQVFIVNVIELQAHIRAIINCLFANKWNS